MQNKKTHDEYMSLVRSAIGEGKRYFVFSFGCLQNEADSERIRGMLENMGYLPARDHTEANIIIVNTCAIREHAEMKALSLIGNFKAQKKRDPDLIVGIVGCMAAEEHIANKLKCDFHYVSFTLEPSLLHEIPRLVFDSITENRRSFIFGSESTLIEEGLPVRRTSSHSALVSVMYGCNNFCSYCIVPYVRGRERSRDSKEIIAECRELISGGIKEITLLGQNVNSYRSDISFAQLLSSIAEIDADFILRFMTSHPKDTSDALIEVMKKHKDKIAPFFHLPLQAGSDRVLRSMNRTYTVERYLDIVKKLRAAVPDIALSTDVIVGFPGEEEEDFLGTMRVLSEVRFDNVYAFLYSRREGTRAASMENTVPEDIKKERLARLLKQQDKINLEKNLPYENNTFRVLVDSSEMRDGRVVYTGRTSSSKLVHFEADSVNVGEFKTVKINKACAYDLYGEEI